MLTLASPLLRAVATDLDGTLLRSDGSISNFTRLTLQGVVGGGVHLVLVTARPVAATLPIAKQLGSPTIICLSGAVSYDTATQEIIDTTGLGRHEISLLAEQLAGACTRVALGYETSLVRYLERQWDFSQCSLTAGVPTQMLERGTLPKDPRVLSVLASCAHHHGTCLENTTKVWRADWGTVFSPVRGIIEITAPGVNKVTALAKFCAKYELTNEQVVAFGDSINDAEMLNWVGTGFAVANAAGELGSVQRLGAGMK